MKRHEIRSRLDGRLLHVTIRAEDFPRARADISDPGEALQLAVIAAPSSTVYKPHRHFLKACPPAHVTQETWIVVRGSVAVDYYDTDGRSLGSAVLGPGDCTITYAGGHGYQILTDDARIYEVKSGPYSGSPERDKEYIR